MISMYPTLITYLSISDSFLIRSGMLEGSSVMQNKIPITHCQANILPDIAIVVDGHKTN